MTLRSLVPGLAVVLLLTACGSDATEEATPTAAGTGVPTVEPDPDQPVPVEGDGGIGGEGGAPVTSNLILSSDAGGADQVEVVATCLVAPEPPTYRLDLAGGGSLTVATGDEGGGFELALDGTTYRSPEDQPPVANASEGALSVQGPAVADSGEQRFVDAVIGLDDLPDC